jgi:hypothetical protein
LHIEEASRFCHVFCLSLHSLASLFREHDHKKQSSHHANGDTDAMLVVCSAMGNRVGLPVGVCVGIRVGDKVGALVGEGVPLAHSVLCMHIFELLYFVGPHGPSPMPQVSQFVPAFLHWK